MTYFGQEKLEKEINLFAQKYGRVVKYFKVPMDNRKMNKNYAFLFIGEEFFSHKFIFHKKSRGVEWNPPAYNLTKNT